MARIVVGSPNLTQPLLLYPGLGPAMLEQHRRSYNLESVKEQKLFVFLTKLSILPYSSAIFYSPINHPLNVVPSSPN
jgi:hypothetical protein